MATMKASADGVSIGNEQDVSTEDWHGANTVKEYELSTVLSNEQILRISIARAPSISILT